MENGEIKEKINIHERIKGLEIEVSSVKDDVNQIMNNHLAHLKIEIDKINSRMGWGIMLAFSTLVGILVDLLFK